MIKFSLTFSLMREQYPKMLQSKTITANVGREQEFFGDRLSIGFTQVLEAFSSFASSAFSFFHSVSKYVYIYFSLFFIKWRILILGKEWALRDILNFYVSAS